MVLVVFLWENFEILKIRIFCGQKFFWQKAPPCFHLTVLHIFDCHSNGKVTIQYSFSIGIIFLFKCFSWCWWQGKGVAQIYMDCVNQLSSLAETIIIVLCPIISTFMVPHSCLLFCAKMKCWCMVGLVRKREWLGMRPFLWHFSDEFQGSIPGTDRRLSWTPWGSLVGLPDHRKVWSLKHFFFADLPG